MKSILTWFFASIAFILGIYALLILYKEIKNASKRTPNDDLFDLDWKLQSSLLDEHSYLYFITLISEYRKRPEINQEFLSVLEIQFKERFKDFKEIAEYDIEMYADMQPHIKQKDVDIDYQREDGK